MSIIRLNHLMVTIPPDTEAQARQYYCELLGLHEIPKPDSLVGRGGLWLQLGNIQIHLGIEIGNNRADSKAHIAYEVDDLDYWRERLLAYGYSIGDSIPIEGWERFETRDPFGNRVEFIQRAHASVIQS
jgi:catechol 2,3-dioxygenase-like lactoylglutathione lyase family enzyme